MNADWMTGDRDEDNRIAAEIARIERFVLYRDGTCRCGAPVTKVVDVRQPVRTTDDLAASCGECVAPPTSARPAADRGRIEREVVAAALLG
ncbi:hypothetical protein OJ997_01885 [Solirubrobacter phytolaccae]|uniref:Uncharacterized protein n=1 Tax=Solirubrobacter phytolaccae TaxID=1404360 RepID=A0A9X3S5K2_9ACTN|nr:hypothetical protein [Solirubrobacter phytolaccae]MDA0179029.1 hypothetical protein [Solirubrobacter phytolaccae]